jgi:hypothetical protein
MERTGNWCEEGFADYQLVGEVMAHQGYDD